MKNLKFYLVAAMLTISTFINAQVPSEMPVGKSFIIQSAQNVGRNPDGCWDLPGYFYNESEFVKGKNIVIWTLDEGADRLFTIESSPQSGYYEIMVGKHSVARVDIKGGHQKDGAELHLWDDLNKSSQRFLFDHKGDGRFKIYTTDGKIVNLQSKNSKNGNKVRIWKDHDGIHNEWFLLDPVTKKPFIPTRKVALKTIGDKPPVGRYIIQSAISKGRSAKGCWDFPGDGFQDKNNENLKIWNLDSIKSDRYFQFYKSSNKQYYNIRIGNTGYYIDLVGGKTADGSNIASWYSNNGPNQDFYFKHLGNGRYKIYHRSGKIVCLKASNDKNGNNIHLWKDHNSIQTEWYFITADDSRKVYIPK